MSASKDTINIIFHVTDFVDVLQDRRSPGHRGTKAWLDTAANPNNRRIEIKGAKGKERVKIKAKGATIRYKVTIESDPTGKDKNDEFYPRGITFANIGSSPTVTTKAKIAQPDVFPFLHLRFSKDGRILTIPDAFKDYGRNDKYKVSVLIQSKNTGGIGIIDPPWDHDNSGR